jgi:hypothetical protein
MRCPKCAGIGSLIEIARGWRLIPCPDCGGSGIVHCCEGDSIQPDPPGSRPPIGPAGPRTPPATEGDTSHENSRRHRF